MEAPDKEWSSARNARLSSSRLVLRPVGYLALVALWAALFLVMVIADSGMFLAIAPHLGDGATVVSYIEFLLIIVIIAPILGPALVILTVLTLSLTCLAASAFVRALLPANAGRSITLTTRSDDTIGPQTTGQTAVSMQPTGTDRFSQFWAHLMLTNMSPTWPMIRAYSLIGAAYLFTVGWVKWPTRSPFALACCALLTAAPVIIAARWLRPAFRSAATSD